MKKSNKKILAIILVLAMVTGCFAGCGTQEPNAESSNSQTTSESASEKTENAQEEELKTIRILAVDGSHALGNGETVYLTDWIEGENKLWQQLTSDLAEYGVKIEVDVILSDQAETTIPTMVAAGLDDYDMANLWYVDDATYRNMIEQQQFVPITELWENYSDGTSKAFYTEGLGSKVVGTQVMPDGNNYHIMSMYESYYQGEVPGSCVVAQVIRYDWLQKLGLEMPKTADEFYNALVAFQENDMNHNGVKDEVVYAPAESFRNGIAQMFGLHPFTICLDPETGKIGSVFYQDTVKDYIQYMNKLYTAGLLDTSDQYDQNLVENKYGAQNTYWLVAWDEPLITVEEGDLAPQYVPCLPKADVADKAVLDVGFGFGGTGRYCVLADADKEAVGRLLDYLCTEEYRNLTEHGIEGYTYEIVDGELVYIDDPNVPDTQVMKGSGGALWGGVFPRYQVSDLTTDINAIEAEGLSLGYPETGFKEKADANRYVYEHYDEYVLGHNPVEVLAQTSDEEAERLNEIMVDFETYYQELLLKLIMGEKSLDDWDSYIADLKELGMDDIIKIYQDRYDRAH